MPGERQLARNTRSQEVGPATTQHKCVRNVKGYLLGSKSKSIEKCPVRDNCMRASRLLGYTKKLETVTELSLGGEPEILGLGWPTTRFGLDKLLTAVHCILHYVAQYLAFLRECFFCFLCYNLKKKKKHMINFSTEL